MKLNHLVVMPKCAVRAGTGYIFPLGIAYVSSAMKKEGFRVITLNPNNEEEELEKLLPKVIQENGIDILLTGGLTGQYETIREILEIAKKVKPEIKTVVGGGIITSAPEAGMRALEIADYGIIGEGEVSVCELLHAIEKGEAVLAVDGLICIDGSRYIQTNPRKEIADLDQIDFPDYEGFGFGELMRCNLNSSMLNRKKTAMVVASRSCPFQCTFCFHSSGNQYRQRSLENIFQEIDCLVERYGAENLMVVDELFAAKRERIVAFCNRIKTYGIKWNAQFRVADVDGELIKLMKDCGCVSISYGLESADDHILKSMKKKITLAQIERALKLTYEGGIPIVGNFIFGDVEETVESAERTLSWWENHLQYKIRLSNINIFPGTALYKYALEKGIIQDEVAFIRDGCPLINVSKMSQAEFSDLTDRIKTLNRHLIDDHHPRYIADVAYDRKNKDVCFSGECVSCGKRNLWQNILPLNIYEVRCEACGQVHGFPIFDEVKASMEETLDGLLNEYKQIAIWGVGEDFFRLFNRQIMEHPAIYFVDQSPEKQNTSVYHKAVHAPELIRRREISVVVVSTLQFYPQIKKTIEANFRGVRRILKPEELA